MHSFLSIVPYQMMYILIKAFAIMRKSNMKNLSLILILFFVLVSAQVKSQNTASDSSKTTEWAEQLTGGVGVGFDYGGIGVNMGLFTGPFGVFVGLGENGIGMGFNAGAKFKLTERMFTPFLIGMYGYNTTIAIAGYGQSVFNGITLGAGVDVALGKSKKAYFSLAVLRPFRTSKVDEYIDRAKSQGVQFDNSLSPFTISIGFKVVLHR
ncbi:hypothetical protein BKI52_30860 [marine bacterium AO1-C]|nr:hypothetical protein BKI52_30860 [marine bacterium AO1-C]